MINTFLDVKRHYYGRMSPYEPGVYLGDLASLFFQVKEYLYERVKYHMIKYIVRIFMHRN